MLCCAVLYCAVLCCAVLCCAVLCCAVLCCAVLCYAVLCCAVLCCAVLCCAVLYCVTASPRSLLILELLQFINIHKLYSKYQFIIIIYGIPSQSGVMRPVGSQDARLFRAGRDAFKCYYSVSTQCKIPFLSY